MSDLRVALRRLAKSPSYVAVVTLTLGLAIGATTAIFSVVDGVLLRPLPYRDPAALITIWEKSPNFDRMSVSYPDFLDWERGQTTLASIACARNESYNLIGPAGAERLYGIMLSSRFFETMGLEPALGRGFTAEEDQEHGPRAAMLSYGLWQRRFGGARDVVGRTIDLSGEAYTIVGVLPRDFRVDPKTEIATAIGTITANTRQRGNHPGISGFGRLKPGVTVEQARADLEGIGRQIAAAYPDNASVVPAIAPYHADLVKDVRPMLLVLMGAVVFVLLVAVANVANLALARGTARRKEMAVRAALGASRAALIRQVLVESGLVALLGGALGILLALWGVDLLNGLRPDAIPQETTIRVDLGVLGFCLVVSIASGLLAGLVPALHAGRTELHEVLKDADQRTATGGRHHGRTRNALVVAEVGLALILLVGAGLSIRGFVELLRVDPGFRPDDVVTMAISLPRGEYDTAEKISAFRDTVRAKLETLPGVAAATLSSGLPLAGAAEAGYRVEGEPPPQPGHGHMAVYYPVDGRYLETLRLQLVAGRFVADSDTAAAAPVIVVDDHLAKTVFASQDALGKVIRFNDQPRTIVGVVRHVTNYGPGQPEPAKDQLYVPWKQVSKNWFVATNSGVNVTLRAQPGIDPASLFAAAQAQVAAVDAAQPVYEVQTLHKLLDDSVGARRFAMLLLGVFAVIALVLAVVGLYSVMSYLVEQRRHEVGVRMALGARPRDVERLVVGQGLRLTAIGLLLGVLGSLALTGVMSSILYGVRPSDPITFVVVAAILTLAATLATWLPARRAARVDPMTALRAD